nr:hypothetical protein [Campylobacter sp.]
YCLDGDFVFGGKDSKFVLKQNLNMILEFKSKNFKPLCGKECGYSFVSDSFTLSYAPIACENFKNLDKLNPEFFDKIKTEILDDMSSVFAKEMPVGEFIQKFHDCIKNHTKSGLISDKIRVVLKLDKAEAMLDNFFINDISKILQSGDFNKNLLQIFDESEVDKNARIDMRKAENLDFLINKFNKFSYPLGAWASKKMLNFSQQIAVNEIIKLFNEAKGGIYSVNGPPGTGKTRLLKDIIAQIIIKRAEILAKNDGKIFDTGVKLEGSEFPDFFPLKDEYKGFEILVASSNNKAVENISHELPLKQSIDDFKLDYFSDFATMLLSSKNKNSNFTTEAWGLISVALGKSSNINKFKDFLYQIQPKIGDKINELEKRGLTNKFKNIFGFASYLAFTNLSSNFDKAKAEFLDAKQRVENLNDAYFEEFEKLKNTYDKLKPYANAKIEDEIDARQNLLNELNSSLEKLTCPPRPILQEYQAILPQPNNPGIIANLFKTEAYKNYLDECEKVSNANKPILENNIKISQENQQLMDKYEQDLKIFNDKKSQLDIKFDETKKALNDLNLIQKEKQNFLQIEQEISTFIICNDRKKLELSSPFMYDENGVNKLGEARIELFIKALNLHKEAILLNAKKFAKNLNMLFRNDHYSSLKKEIKLNIFQSLFMVTPVVSTTFAATQRFLDKFGVGKDDLALILIDEAGQANISNAVGALWRAKTAVIVGDPLQLKPIVTLPKALNSVLLKHCDAKDEFNLAQTSLQNTADKVQKLGAYIGETWVGSPLIVHRRCDEPMFSISNETTYDNAMIWGKAKNNNYLAHFGVESAWIDIKGNFVGNSCEEELNAADKIYNFLLALNDKQSGLIDPSDIKVITPFTDVVRSSRAHKCYANTIHTMQGQEANIIILVLGGGSNAARAWASMEPNLLNVAISRAKNYIFIIGDKSTWSKLQYFSVAAKKLPTKKLGDFK